MEPYPSAALQTLLRRTVEPALLRTYGVPKKRYGAFRGRLGDLQKAGLYGRDKMPGKGAVLVYGPDEMHKQVFACEMFEFGLSPAVILALVKADWDREDGLRDIFFRAGADIGVERSPPSDDVILYIDQPAMMTCGWAGKLPAVGSCRLSELPRKISEWMQPTALLPRMIIVNLGARLRRFHRELVEVNEQDMAAEHRRKMKAAKKRKGRIEQGGRKRK